MKVFIKVMLCLLLLAVIVSSCKKDRTKNTNTDIMPTAAFDISGTPTVNNEISFTNASKNATAYKWDFGNGQISTTANPKAKYTTEGPYDVILIATNGSNRAVYKQTIYIAADNQPAPFFTFSFKDGKESAPAIVSFSNQSVNALNYKWVINGTTSYEKDPTYTFNQSGDFIVSLTAINGNKEASYTDVVHVDANQDPQAAFVLPYHPYPYQANEAIQFVNQSKNADAWEWTFGTNGPAASTEQHPEVKFAANGIYTITLVAKKGTKRSAPRSVNLKIGQ